MCSGGGPGGPQGGPPAGGPQGGGNGGASAGDAECMSVVGECTNQLQSASASAAGNMDAVCGAISTYMICIQGAPCSPQIQQQISAQIAGYQDQYNHHCT